MLSPHTDDGELGAGGTIAKLLEGGSEVHYVAFSIPREELKEECERALAILRQKKWGIHIHTLKFETREFPRQRQKILQKLYDLNVEHSPDLVLTPSTNDNHQDHQVVTNEAIRTFKECTVLGYELPWNAIIFIENCFVRIEDRHLQLKIGALAQYYSQNNRHYFSPEYIKAVAYSRGGQIGGGYAEAFEVIKSVYR